MQRIFVNSLRIQYLFSHIYKIHRKIFHSVPFPHLQIQVYHFVLMHVLHTLADLPHEQYTVPFGQGEVIGDHPLKKFSTGNTTKYITHFNRFPEIFFKIFTLGQCLLFGDHHDLSRALESGGQ